jgi:hypothetical protein
MVGQLQLQPQLQPQPEGWGETEMDGSARRQTDRQTDIF